MPVCSVPFRIRGGGGARARAVLGTELARRVPGVLLHRRVKRLGEAPPASVKLPRELGSRVGPAAMMVRAEGRVPWALLACSVMQDRVSVARLRPLISGIDS